MPYLNLYVHRRRKVFVASALQDTRIVLPSFYREERVPVAVRMVDDDPANGLGALAEADISDYTCTVGIGTPGNETPLAQQTLAWDAELEAFVGVLVVLTDEMIAALDAALPADYISKKFEVELQKDNGGVDDEEITAQEDCVVRNEVIFGGTPLNLALQLFPTVLFGALRVDSPIDTGDTPVNPTGSDAVVIGGVEGTTYTVRVRVKGTVETRNYTGGSVGDPLLPYFYIGGAIVPENTRNIYKLEISDPPQTYYLNHDTDPVEVVDLDYVVLVQMAAGATVTLSYDSIDDLQIGDQELAVYFAGSFAHNGAVPVSVPTDVNLHRSSVAAAEVAGDTETTVAEVEVPELEANDEVQFGAVFTRPADQVANTRLNVWLNGTVLGQGSQLIAVIILDASPVTVVPLQHLFSNRAATNDQLGGADADGALIAGTVDTGLAPTTLEFKLHNQDAADACTLQALTVKRVR